MRGLVLVGFVVVAVGCGSSANSPQVQAARSRYEATIPTCDGDADCKAKWEAAQLWVVHNLAFKIQTATDVLIETYNGTDNSDTRLAGRVTKEPLGGGRYKFVVYVGCRNPFGCGPNPWAAAQHFNDTLNAVTP